MVNKLKLITLAMEDVSIFIDMFLEESKQQYQLEKRIRESKYDGLNGFDLFHR